MIIYKIINLINGKIYIGQTTQGIKKRWIGHCRGKKSTYISNAILKHGKENFSIEEIDSAQTLEELNIKEMYWIKFYMSTDRNIGYNLKEGGNSSPCAEETKIKIGLANSQKTASPETRAKISKAHKGKVLSAETRCKMSESRMGHNVPEETRLKISEKHKGREMNDEWREKMRQAKLGTKHTEEHKKRISDSNTGLKRSEEFCEKMRGVTRPKEVGEKISLTKKNSGYKHSEETRAKQKANFTGGRTGQKNSPESSRKMVETKTKKKLIKRIIQLLKLGFDT